MKEEAKLSNEKMAKYLKTLREESDLSMRDMSAILGITHSFIGKTEQQGRRLDVGEFICYCRAMEKDPAVVLQAIMAL